MIPAYIAELVGTFAFILVILASDGNAYIIGAALAIVILLIGSISGGHVNPAVSFAMFMKGGMTPVEVASYVVAQWIGGIGAVYAYRML
jgi:aquaporin Z